MCKKVLKIVVVVVLTLSSFIVKAELNFDKFLAKKDVIFDLSYNDFMSKESNKDVFRVICNGGHEIGYPASKKSPKMTCFGVRLLKSIIIFHDKKLKTLSLCFFEFKNRDHGRVKVFFSRKDKLIKAISNWSGDKKPFFYKIKSKNKKEKEKYWNSNTNRFSYKFRKVKGKTICYYSWIKNNCVIIMKYSFSGKKRSSRCKLGAINVYMFKYKKGENPKQKQYDFSSVE